MSKNPLLYLFDGFTYARQNISVFEVYVRPILTGPDQTQKDTVSIPEKERRIKEIEIEIVSY